MDFVRALVNIQHPGIAPVFLQLVPLRCALDPKHALGVANAPVQRFARVVFPDSGLGAHRFCAVMVGPPNQLIGERLDAVQLRRHAAEDAGCVEVAFLGERAGLFDDLRHHRHGAHAQAHPTDVQCFERVDLTASLDADDVLARDADAIQAQLVGGGAALAHLLFVTPDDQSFRVPVDEEPGRAFLRAGVQAEHPGHMAVGDPHLGAVELVVLVKFRAVLLADLSDVEAGRLRHVERRRVEQRFAFLAEEEIFGAVRIREHLHALQLRAGLNPAGIATGARFGQRKRADLAGTDPAEIKFRCLGAPVEIRHDSFGIRANSVERGESGLRFRTEFIQVHPQPGAPGVHEVLQKFSGNCAEHGFLADVVADTVAQRAERVLHLQHRR